MSRFPIGPASVLLGALMLLAPAGAALAQDDGYGYRFQPSGDSGLSGYAGLRGSFAFGGSINSTVPTAPPAALHAAFDQGGGGSVYVGTRLPAGFRLELEGLYRTTPVSNVTLAGTALNARGYSSVAGPMVNLLWDLPVDDFPIRPFIGAGIGGGYTKTSLKDTGGDYLNNSNWNLAYEAMAGVAVPMSQSSRFTAMYRWLRVDDVKFKCGTTGLAAGACKSNVTSQSLDLGLEMDM